MPRQLPWKIKGSPKPSPQRSEQTPRRHTPSTVPSPAPSPVPATRSSSWPKPSSSAKSRRSLTAKPARSPSTSPPPQPPSEQLMVEGFDQDDRYRMVEDELLFVAGTFTKHLHAAEYQRLKSLASSRNAETIRTISRPVTRPMSQLVKRRQEAVCLATSQRRGLKRALGKRSRSGTGLDSDDDRRSAPARNSLQFLMNSPQKKAVPLSAVVGITAGPRATAGAQSRRGGGLFAGAAGRARSGSEPRSRSRAAPQEEVETTDSGSDDLDAQPALPSRLVTHRSVGLSGNRSTSTPSPTGDARASNKPEPHQEFPRTSAPYVNNPGCLSLSGPINGENLTDDGDDDDDLLKRIRHRRAEKKRRQDSSGAKKEKKSGRFSLDTIPLF